MLDRNPYLARLTRYELEALALEVACACQYYTLADAIEETPDADLIQLILSDPCEVCEGDAHSVPGN